VIDVDISEALPESLMQMLESLDLVEAVLDDVAASARAKWQRLAQTELHTTRQSYIEGIQEVESEPGLRSIALVGWLANAVENGMDSFDLRETLLGPNATTRRASRSGGWYANVPFRHGTPGSTGLAGQPMGSPYAPAGALSRAGGPLTADAAKALGKAVYAAAKRLSSRGPHGKGRTTVPASEGGPLLRPHHATGIYTGMRHERKPYVNPTTGKTTVQSTYGTFRRISTENTTGWIHPGIEPHRFVEQVADHVGVIVPAVINQAIQAAMSGK
jgi:hypothetical protein